MNAFETALLDLAKGIVANAGNLAPIFIHSPRGMMIFNASDALATSAMAQLPAATQQAAPNSTGNTPGNVQ